MVTDISIMRLIPEKYYEVRLIKDGKIVIEGSVKEIMSNCDLELGKQ